MWRVKFTGDLTEALEDHFNLYQRDVDLYKQSPLRALLVRGAPLPAFLPFFRPPLPPGLS